MRDAFVTAGDILTFTKGVKPPEDGQVSDLVYLTADYLRGQGLPRHVPSSSRLVLANDACSLILWDGAGAGDVFRAEPGVVASTMAAAVLRRELEGRWSPAFVHLCLKAAEPEMKRTLRGTTVPHVAPETVQRLRIPAFELDMQHRIVDLMNAADVYVAAADARVEVARTARSALLTDLLSAPGDDWEEATLGSLAEIQIGPAFQSGVFRDAIDGTRLLRGMNVGPGRARWAETFFWPDEELAGFERYLLGLGDICIAMDATFTSDGHIRAAVITADDLPALLVQRVARFRIEDPISRQFVWAVIQSTALSRYLAERQTGAFAPHISGKDLATFRLLVPPSPEKHRIVDLMNAADAELQASSGAADAARTLRSALLAELLSGSHEIPPSYDRFLEAA